jgi:hippurate hydrolase
VKLIWQPAEEGGGGADKLVPAGVLDGTAPRTDRMADAIFGLHGWPGLPVGTVATKPGAILAATDNFIATFRGKGCHGALSALGVDPIVHRMRGRHQPCRSSSAARPTRPSRASSRSARFTAGTAVNVIPDTGAHPREPSARSPTAPPPRGRGDRAPLRGIALADDCELEFTWHEGYPATVNDPANGRLRRRRRAADARPRPLPPLTKASMGGEDFAYYLEKIPGCFFSSASSQKDCGPAGYPSLHSDCYDFTDASLAVGMRMFLELVTRYPRG